MLSIAGLPALDAMAQTGGDASGLASRLSVIRREVQVTMTLQNPVARVLAVLCMVAVAAAAFNPVPAAAPTT